MQGTVSGLVASYGYVVLFFLVGLESLGLPLPGETALVTAAAFAALGHLSIYGVVTTAVAAAVIGDNGGYWIGRKGGIALVRRYGRFLHLNEAHLDSRARGSGTDAVWPFHALQCARRGVLGRGCRRARLRVRPQFTAARALYGSGQPGRGPPRRPDRGARARVALVRAKSHEPRHTHRALEDVCSRALRARRVSGAAPHARVGNQPRRIVGVCRSHGRRHPP